MSTIRATTCALVVAAVAGAVGKPTKRRHQQANPATP